MKDETITRFYSPRFVGFLAALLGLNCALAFQIAQAAVTVDQTPLTVQKPLAPNVVLMLDDSGSMAWDFMPDASFLNGASTVNNGGDTIVTADALRNSSNNGVYYNPAVIYTVPVTVTGGNYAASPGLGTAFADGFLDQTVADEVDVTRYSSSSLCDYNNYSTSNCPSNVSGSFPYYTAFSNTATNTYAATLVCPSGYTLQTSGTNAGQCKKNSNPNAGSLKSPTPTCNAGDAYNTGTGLCTTSVTTTTYLFTYTTTTSTSGAGPYTQNYIGKTGDCLAAGVNSTICTDSATAQQNVANWFSYYRTRILTAKSGLLISFNTLDPTIRLGFGSIDGNNRSFISGLSTSAKYSYTDNYNNRTNYVATVQPFDQTCVTSTTNPCTPGASGTQRANFWSWVTNESANNGTPLRQALNAVGQYYSSAGPWQNSSSDTTELACRQAYTILTTDGFWNDSVSNIGFPSNQYNDNIDGGPGGSSTTTSSYGATLSCPAGYTAGTGTRVGQCKKNSNGTYSNNGTWTCPSGGTYQSSYNGNSNQCVVTTTATGASVTITGPNGRTYTYPASSSNGAPSPYADGNSDTLADVAMYYWLTDLQSNVANEVPTSTEDPAFWQHMTTFTLGLGFKPTGITPSSTTVDQIFAAANGGTALDPSFAWPTPVSNSIYNIADLAHAGVDGHGGFYSATSPQAFSSGIANALERVQTRVGTGASLAANSTKLTTGTVTYQAIYHSGNWDGDLYAFNVNSTSGAIATLTNWTAAAALPTSSNRNIWTYNPTGSGASNQFVAFSSPSKLSSAEQSALGASTTVQQNIINYLRGDASNEQQKNGIYRTRSTALGDIINSQPVYVGAPNPNLFFNISFTGSNTYATFATNGLSRTPAIWIAANDGMLHAFKASDGTEIFAYLPAAVITNGIVTLSDPTYGGTTVPHQDFNDGQLAVADVYTGSTPAWRTVLVGTTGRGVARAVYALDVTDPTAPIFLWERSAGDGLANSNYIGEITGQPVIAQTANGTWSVIIGNGYNSAAGTAALLQFDVTTGSLTVRTAGTTTNNALAAPVVWIANPTNNLSTIAYAGDLAGNVWSFDLTSSTANGTVLFTTGSSQPITGGMLAGKDPLTGNVWLFFGTGKYLTQSDLSTTTTQAWYGIIAQSQTANLVSNLSNGLGALVKRSIISETDPDNTTTPPTLGSRTISSATAGDMNGMSGWYINLLPPSGTAQGERMVTPNEFQGSLLIGTTLIPTSTDVCNPSGSGWIMAINPFTGTNPSSPFFDINNDGTFDTSGVGFSSVPNNPIFVGNSMLTSFDNASNSSIKTAGGGGPPARQSWRELIAH